MRSQPPHAEGERAAAPSATHLREALQQIREVHYREAHQVRVRNGSARGTDGSTTTATAAASIATSASRTAGDALEERLHQLPQGQALKRAPTHAQEEGGHRVGGMAVEPPERRAVAGRSNNILPAVTPFPGSCAATNIPFRLLLPRKNFSKKAPQRP